MINTKTSKVNILLGIAIFGALAFLLPRVGFEKSAGFALALLVTMVYWWITRPVHITVTALLPILVGSLLNLGAISDILANYFSPIAVLLVGSGIIVAAWNKSGLSKRIALKALGVIGTGVKMQLVVWFVLATFASAFLPNAVVAATLCPIAAAMLAYTEDHQNKTDPMIRNLIFLAIVWGAGLGGFGTPLGGAMNLVAISHIEALTGEEFLYITWTAKMLPYLLVMAGATLVYLVSINPKQKKLAGSKAFFTQAYSDIGKMKRSEVTALVLFLVALILAFTRPLYQTVLPTFKPFYAFLLSGMLAFVLTDKDKNPIITWDVAVKEINWSMIMLFSGGMAIGKLLISTGAAATVAGMVASANITNVYFITFTFIALGMFLANTSSNTAATAVLVPIVISVMAGQGNLQMVLVLIAAAACNAAFVLPTSIRAIPVGYGLDVKVMFKYGLAAVLISLATLTVAAYIRIALV